MFGITFIKSSELAALKKSKERVQNAANIIVLNNDKLMLEIGVLNANLSALQVRDNKTGRFAKKVKLN